VPKKAEEKERKGIEGKKLEGSLVIG